MKNAKQTFLDNIKHHLFDKFGKRKYDTHKEEINKTFTIISCNCIGGIVYHNLGAAFSTPTINLFIETPDFLKLCLNLNKYMNDSMREASDSMLKGYPIGILGDDIRIHFAHYQSFEEAINAWERRKQRINYDNIFVIATDRDGFEERMLEQLDLIEYPKVFFSHKKLNNDYSVYVKSDKAKPTVSDLTRFVNIHQVRKFEYYFDIYKWLTGKYSVSECLLNQ